MARQTNRVNGAVGRTLTIDSLADEDEADYLLVDIESARQLGIMPIGYHP